jgi:hypothetical protein
MDTGDEVLAVAAAQRLLLIRTDRWPIVAAHLLAAGVDGQNTVTLAGLPRSASGWEVDQLVPLVLAEAGATVLTVDEASEVVVRLLGQGLPGPGRPIVRTLAAIAPQYDYPGGFLGKAYQLAEWLDCDCHEGSAERQEVDRFEAEIRSLPPLRVPQPLAAALVAG